MTKQTNRRDLLALMGLASADFLVNTEAMATPVVNADAAEGFPNMATRGLETQIRIAEALERLAKGIRDGAVAAIELKTVSSVSVDDWLAHDVTVRIEMLRTMS
jgi:hypothetical protein